MNDAATAVQNLRSSDPFALQRLRDLLKVRIEQRHIEMETASGDEYLRLQGEIRAYRQLWKDTLEMSKGAR